MNASAVVFRRREICEAISATREDLLGWTIAGDWRLYVEICKKDGKVAYLASPLNKHRRHHGSVVGSNDLSNHLKEIVRMHEVVNKYIKKKECVINRQLNYRKKIQSQIF